MGASPSSCPHRSRRRVSGCCCRASWDRTTAPSAMARPRSPRPGWPPKPITSLPQEGDPMCLGVPGRVVEVHDDRGLAMGVVDFGGGRREVCLAYIADQVQPGDYALVHVGFAISRIDEAED